MRRPALTLRVLCTAALACAPQARAAVFNVPAGDAAALITAIESANANGEADTIVLPAGTYSYGGPHNTAPDGANALPRITSDVTIEGAGSAATFIEGAAFTSGFRLLYVAGEGSLALRRLTLRRAQASAGSTLERSGAAVFNQGALDVEDVIITENTAAVGGGIHNLGTAVIRGSTLSANTATLEGGAIANDAYGRIFLYDSVVEQNSAKRGGGLNTTGASVTIARSTFRSNQASEATFVTSAGGGGVRALLNLESVGYLFVTASAFENNSTAGYGGAIRSGVIGLIENTTLSGNSAGGDGGGLYSARLGDNAVINSTITANTADSDSDGGRGGGIYSLIGNLFLANTIVAGNTSLTGTGPDCDGDIFSDGHNLIQNTAGCERYALGDPDLENVDPLLAPLANSGGPTKVHMPQNGSPALDAAGSSHCRGIDQRGYARPADGDGAGGAACDIGAAEPSASPAAFSPDPFLCYSARTTGDTAPFAGASVHLTDAFESKQFRLKKTTAICLPSEVNGVPAGDPATDLKSYLARPERGEPRHVDREGLVVRNSLGQFVVDTLREDSLLVPAAAGEQAPVVAPDPGSHSLDHFLCYRARTSPGQAKVRRARLRAAVDNGLGPLKLFKVGKVRRLCNAADKDGQGFKDPNAHLLCLSVTRIALEPVHVRRNGLYTADQLGNEQLDTRKDVELCVPSSIAP